MPWTRNQPYWVTRPAALLAQMLAGRGLSAATVAIDPGVFRACCLLPASALKLSGPFLINPLTRGRAITLTFDQRFVPAKPS
jgi:hypothetical protein